jgi:TPR repeat protein
VVGGLEHPELQRIRGLEATAEEGDLDATYVLGLIATNGSEVSEPDERKARELQAWASWHGHIDATFEYSLLLRQGIGGPRDTVTADRLERVAAEAGHPRACLNVGARVHAERGDCEEVAGWYERASLGGSKEAALRLVQMFLRDDGLPRDETVARKWLVHALVDCGALFDGLAEVASALTPPTQKAPPSPVAEHRRLIGQLLDHDASEVFDKLEQLLDTAPQLGEALLLEMAARKMDLRGAIALLRDRVDRDTLKGWVLGAVPDELERLVYLAMI